VATVLVNGRRGGNGHGSVAALAARPLRCAIYTRKSTDEGLDSDFNSLDAQRDAGEAYVASQRAEGWVALAERYDDGGFSGGSMERPALRRLLADVEAERVDCVIVYKIDRLSRSLLDFSRIIEVLDRNGTTLVAVTQPLNTSTSLGKLTLNMLLSFAQFEREIIGERTRDKIRAARRRGKWTGGTVPMGYDLAQGGGRLVMNGVEAAQVREVFRLYLECGSLIATAEELNRRGWKTKISATKDGGHRGGVPWSKSSVHRVLSSPAYIARVVVDGAAFKSESPAIVERATWTATQERLAANGGEHCRAQRYDSGALLKGLAFCSCGASLTPTFVSRPVGHAKKRFSYYACSRRIKQGKAACSAPYVPAHRLESAVVAEIAKHAQEPAVIAAVAEAARQQLAEKRRRLNAERRALDRALRDAAKERGSTPPERLPAVDARVAAQEARRAAIHAEVAALAAMEVDPDHVARTVADFPTLWAALLPRERRRVVEMIVERLVVDGVAPGPSIALGDGTGRSHLDC